MHLCSPYVFLLLLYIFKKLSKGRQGMAPTKKPTVGAQFKVGYTVTALKFFFLTCRFYTSSWRRNVVFSQVFPPKMVW